MGWIRELFTGGENERAASERYPGPRDRDVWQDERRGRDAGEWRAARDAWNTGAARGPSYGYAARDEWHPGATRSWSEHPREDPGGTFGRSPASHQTGWYGVPQSIDMTRDTSRPIWGSEGSGGWYQGDFSRERGSGEGRYGPYPSQARGGGERRYGPFETQGRGNDERRYGPYEDSTPTSFQWRTGFSEGQTQADAAEPAFNYGVGALMQPMRSPYGGANWTPESQGAHAIGESIYGRSVILPDAKARRRGRMTKGWRRDDRRIAEDVSDRLMDDPRVDASEIDVVVESCVVTLRGKVSDRRAKDLAEDLALEVFGVEDVHNELRAPLSTSLERRFLTAGDGHRGPR